MPSINVVLALAPPLPDDDVLDDATAPPVGAAVVLPAAAARAARCRCLASRAARMAAFWLLLIVLSVLLWIGRLCEAKCKGYSIQSNRLHLMIHWDQ